MSKDLVKIALKVNPVALDNVSNQPLQSVLVVSESVVLAVYSNSSSYRIYASNGKAQPPLP